MRRDASVCLVQHVFFVLLTQTCGSFPVKDKLCQSKFDKHSTAREILECSTSNLCQELADSIGRSLQAVLLNKTIAECRIRHAKLSK